MPYRRYPPGVWEPDYWHALERDWEQEPAGHYRGRGHDQSHTGRSDRWLPPTYGAFIVPPSGPPSGRFVGRGPRGYRRSDERILEDVAQALAWHVELDARNIEVRVEQGVVRLSGTVHHPYERRLAEEIVDEIPWVEDVENRIRVVPGPAFGEVGSPGTWR